jgi:hypothetical protein
MPTVCVRLFEPLAFVFAAQGGAMPQATTVAIPLCIVCQKLSYDPPSRMGFVSTRDETGLFSVCGACADCPDAELERKVIERVMEPAMA